MSYKIVTAFLLSLCLCAGAVLTPALSADDTPKKDPPKKGAKDDDKNKDKKPEVIKRSQTSPAGTATGKVTSLNDQSFILEAGFGRTKRAVEVWIAEDVKVRMPAEFEFDDRGKPKHFKPDPNDPDRRLGGVKGSIADVKDGQSAVVTLGRLPDKRLVATVIVVAEKKK